LRSGPAQGTKASELQACGLGLWLQFGRNLRNIVLKVDLWPSLACTPLAPGREPLPTDMSALLHPGRLHLSEPLIKHQCGASAGEGPELALRANQEFHLNYSRRTFADTAHTTGHAQSVQKILNPIDGADGIFHSHGAYSLPPLITLR
jgi:hypothetical protein